jgi:hypothetical protein
MMEECTFSRELIDIDIKTQETSLVRRLKRRCRSRSRSRNRSWSPPYRTEVRYQPSERRRSHGSVRSPMRSLWCRGTARCTVLGDDGPNVSSPLAPSSVSGQCTRFSERFGSIAVGQSQLRTCWDLGGKVDWAVSCQPRLQVRPRRHPPLTRVIQQLRLSRLGSHATTSGSVRDFSADTWQHQNS